ncbi:MAG: hypothetical protein GXO32_05800 [Crenarchaeota archaeon]|nr:hypothetical protein [Thermoproteota archaeon]
MCFRTRRLKPLSTRRTKSFSEVRIVDPQPKIDYYDFGVIVISGREYRHDVVITPRGVDPDWWRIEGHRLQLADVRDYLAEEADAVVIGTGYSGMMRVDNEVVAELVKRGMQVFIERTPRAVDMYNELVSRGKRVIAFLHLTC